MGRWAQRRRAGGGPTEIIEGHIVGAATGGDPNIVLVEYSRDIDAALFAGTEFTVGPIPVISTGVLNNTPTELSVDFTVDVSASTSITYDGSVPGLKSPDTVAL